MNANEALNLLANEQSPLTSPTLNSLTGNTSQQQQQQQLAIASLFDSLSNLAAASSTINLNMSANNSTQQSLVINNNNQANQSSGASNTAVDLNSLSFARAFNGPNQFESQLSGANSPTINVAAAGAAASPSVAISNSIRSVLAAAMLQQQQQQQQPRTSAIQLNQQQSAGSSSMKLTPQTSTSGANNAYLTDDPMSLLFGNINHQHPQHQQFQLPIQHQDQQPAQPRINYCTICNKELCNKYFMKTHMLKMHGINLEMEQPDSENSNQSEVGDESQVDESAGDGADGELQVIAGAGKELINGGQQLDSQVNGENSTKPKQTINSNKANQLKKTTNSTTSTSTSSTSSTTSSSNGQSGGNKTTSVMNGFAGNSMGGVVCDICNKELCSKYFLKVHKQNTHGIATDYSDVAAQFMYSFAATTGPAPFIGAPVAGAGGASALMSPLVPVPPPPPPAPGSLTNSYLPQQQQPLDHIAQPTLGAQLSGCSGKRVNGNKKLRLQQQPAQQPNDDIDKNSINSNSSFTSNQLINSQSLQATDQRMEFTPPFTLCNSNQSILSKQPTINNANNLDHQNHLVASQLNALMCFSAMATPANPFGQAAAMSPALIVDSILRNQHLFNRNQQPSDSNNNQNNQKQNSSESSKSIQKSNKNSKEPASKYFSHYTEACPMCERRFKSIKWLKTHMMNDHKQEIGAHMQMMMQYFYATKSQQMAAAATMAAIERQQQQLLASQQLAAAASVNLHHHKPPPPPQAQVTSTPPPPPMTANNFNQFNQHHLQLIKRQSIEFNRQQHQQQQFNRQTQCQPQDFSLDTKCKSEFLDANLNSPSISPAESQMSSTVAPPPPPPPNQYTNELNQLKLNFELEKLANIKVNLSDSLSSSKRNQFDLEENEFDGQINEGNLEDQEEDLVDDQDDDRDDGSECSANDKATSGQQMNELIRIKSSGD